MNKKLLCGVMLILNATAFAQSPSLVKDINPGSAQSNYSLNGIIYNNSYIFAADDGSNGKEIWITDGTTGGTSLVKDINPGINDSYPENFMIFNNTVFFYCHYCFQRQGIVEDGWNGSGNNDGEGHFPRSEFGIY